ncbi:histidine kinase [Rugosimonospora africana]|uniref:histidine kinase n=2 Tax=Rugosimonospora africana TaxID=556532 RepID=A0A8J3R0C9_9ACTN|nr:histidine kinase [Rugosimonospora africana]
MRELRWLAAGAAIGVPALALVVVAVVSVPATVAAGLGLVMFGAVMWSARQLATVQRRRAAAVLDRQIPDPYAALPADLPARFRVALRDPGTWRDLAWLPCQFFVGLAGLVLPVALWLGGIECLIAPGLRVLLPEPTGFDPAVLELTGRSGPWTWALVPAGVGLAAIAYRLPRYLIRAQAWLAAALLGPTSAAGLAARVDRLTATRAATVDASATELRRIERDLHDGAQARLVALAMHLGVAEDVIDADPTGAKALLAEARAGAGAALTELRDLVRGIHPPVLADRGLAAAVEALALSSPVPVELDLRLDRRLAAPVESAAYFATAEALTNAIRHGGGGRVRVCLVDAATVLRVVVRDDGRGGADPSLGTGLLGIRRRLSAFDGRLRISSPPGGPTVLDMELPCAF